MGSFNEECDRLSRLADPERYDANEWEKTAGRSIQQAVKDLQSVMQRSDLFLLDKGVRDKRHTLVLATERDKGVEICAIDISVQGDRLVMCAKTIDGSRFTVDPDPPYSEELDRAKPDWLKDKLARIMAKIELRK